MGLEFEDREIARLAAEVAELAGESEAEAVHEALRQRRDRLELASAWPPLPSGVTGKRISKAEREEILGYGPEGY